MVAMFRGMLRDICSGYASIYTVAVRLRHRTSSDKQRVRCRCSGTSRMHVLHSGSGSTVACKEAAKCGLIDLGRPEFLNRIEIDEQSLIKSGVVLSRAES